MWSALALGGCGDAVVPVGDDEFGEEDGASSSTGDGPGSTTETGSTTEAESTESESTGAESTESESTGAESELTESESTTDSRGGDGPCESTHDHSFEGSVVADDCQDFVFSGRVTGNPEPGVWELDTCPCEQECLVPDPQTFVIELWNEDWQPELPACLSIHIGRKLIEPPPIPTMCVIEDVDIYDDQGELVITSHRNYPFWWQAFVGAGYEVTRQTLGEGAACEWWAASELTFDAANDSVTLGEGEIGVLSIDGVDYQVHVPMAHYSPPSEVNSDGEFDRESWMLVRQ
ncbi:hypothetical protein PPSIR1_19359 [Plesiocystis pacifica SIR-1]|uniref:Uncharacterized protein n=1 Tax=Plesiocystis pacifica SIR-1 TaxID=391625 RepID=A6G837_9BACT|nr:hypothetical protein [Plesiocystis pacifica]EDM77999.1 hypothetical protein PPSIR1_19359 [Plesiocystis pacifica SIR-1]